MAMWVMAAGIGAVAILAALSLWLLAQDRRAPPARDGAGWVLRPSRALIPVAAILALASAGFAAGALGRILAGAPGPLAAILALAGLAAGGALWVVIRRRRGLRLRYDMEGLELSRPGRAPLACRWDDLADVRIETRRHRGSMAGPPVELVHLVARLPGGEELRVPASLTGFGHFADLALRMAERSGNRGRDRDA